MKLAIGFGFFLYRKLNNVDGVMQQDSTPQNDSTLGFKWIKKSHKILCSQIFIIHNDHTYITKDYTSLCLSIICNQYFFFKWRQLCSGPSFTQGWKDIGAKTYIFTACANCYLQFWGKVIFKTGNIPSTWSWLKAVVRFESDKSAIINIFMKNIPQANRTCGFEISTGQTKKSLAAGHRTTANFEHWTNEA
jgi:hypothetical protein